MEIPQKIIMRMQKFLYPLRQDLEAAFTEDGGKYDPKNRTIQEELLKVVAAFLLADIDDLQSLEDESRELSDADDQSEDPPKKSRETSKSRPPSDLLFMQKTPKDLQTGNKLMVIFPADPELSPFIVSGANKVLAWSQGKNNKVRTGISERTPEVIFRAAVEQAVAMGSRMQWGNSHPLDSSGVLSSINYVKYYGIEEVDLLVSPDVDMDLSSFGCRVTVAEWLPDRTVVAVPSDRSYLGFFMIIQKTKLTSLIHNAARGVAFAIDWSEKRIHAPREKGSKTAPKQGNASGIKCRKIPVIPS